ncbi:MAG: hypothetical protein EZS28_054134, partial [Streblomastix strix]
MSLQTRKNHFMSITNVHLDLDDSVHEHYEIENSGSKLIGEFNRFSPSTYHNTRSGVIRSFTHHLPIQSKSFRYFDSSGNISTSSISRTPFSIVMETQPRFELWGGWKT